MAKKNPDTVKYLDLVRIQYTILFILYITCKSTKNPYLSKRIAQLLVPETEDIPFKERVRRVNAHCPAVLIENFFMDNKKDLAYLLSQEGRRAIVETIIDGIERCVLTSVSGC